MAVSAINIKANAQEVINLKRKIDELKASLVSMQRSANPALYDKLNNELQTTTIKYNNLRSEVNKYAKEQERAARSTSETSDGLVDLLKKGAALAGITYGVDKIKQLGSEIISVRGEIQQLQIAFETMLGSKEKADRMMADIKKLALSTPFTLTEVADNTKQIIAMGIESDKAIDTVKMLGDVAAGVSVPLWRVAINYGQVSALGKLQSREIRDFAMAGIPIVEELGKMLGKTSSEIYSMVEAGRIGFPEVEQAFKNMSGEGGKFYNLMEKQNASVTGQISKLKDSIQLMFNEIGQDSEGVIYTSINAVSSLVDNYETLGKVLLGLIATYGVHKAAMITNAAITEMVAASNGIFNKSLALRWLWTERVQKAQAFLDKTMLASPYAWAAAAAIALGYGIYKLATYQTESEEAQNRLNESMLESGKAYVTETRELVKLKGELSAATKGSEEYKRIKDQIVSKYGQYYAGLKEEIDTVGLLDSTYKKLTESIMKSFGARQYDKFIKQESDRLDTVINENLTKIQDRIYSKFDDKEAAAKYFSKIRSAIIEGRDLDKSSLSVLDYVAGKGDVIVNRSIEGYIKNIRDAQKITSDIDKKAKERFGVDESSNKATDNTTKSIKSLSDQTEDARKKVSDLKKELEDLQSGKVVKESQSKAIEEKVKEIKDAEDSLSYLVSGKSSSGQNKADKAGQTAADSAREASLKLLNIQAELDSESIKQQLEYEQKLLDIEQDSFDKRYRQNQLNMAKELIATEEFRQKMIKDQQEAAKNIYIKNNGTDIGFNFATFNKTLLPQGLSDADIEAQIKKRTDASLAAWKKGNEDLAKEQKAFADEERLTFASQLDQQIYSIRKHYKERRDLAKGNSELIKQIEKNESREIIEARLQAHQRQLESDAEYNQKYNELTTERYFFESDKRKSSLEQQIKDQKKIFNDLEKRVMNDPNNDELARQLREAFLRLKILNKELEKTPEEKLAEIAGIFKEITGSLSNITGVDLSMLTNAVSGIASFATGDFMGAAASGMGIVSTFITGFMSQKERQAEIQREINKLQQQYNIDLRQQNYDLISSIDYARAFKDNLEALQWLIDKGFISDVDYSAWEALVKQSDEARKNFEIAKKNSDSILSDTNKTLDSLYKDFVKGSAGDAIGNQAKPIISILKDWKDGIIDNEEAFRRLGATGWKGMSDIADKIARSDEETQKWTDQIAELSQQMDEFATGTSFDSFLSDAANAISDLRGNVASLADFTEEKLTNAILSSFKYQILSNALKPMYDELADMFLSGNYDASAANDWKQRLTDILNTNSKELDKIFSAFGIDPKEIGSSSQTPSSGYSVSMSQDTGDKLVGIQTSSQMRLISLDQNVARIAQWNQPVSEKFNFDTIAMPLGALSQSSLRIERMMEENRNIAINSYYELKDINKNTKELYQMNGRLEQIERNTRDA